MSENTADLGTATPTGGQPATAPSPAPSAPPASAAGAEQQLAEATTRAKPAAAERDELRSTLDTVTKAPNPKGGEAEQESAKLASAVPAMMPLPGRVRRTTWFCRLLEGAARHPRHCRHVEARSGDRGQGRRT